MSQLNYYLQSLHHHGHLDLIRVKNWTLLCHGLA